MRINVVGIGKHYMMNSNSIRMNYDVRGVFDNSKAKIGSYIDGFCVDTVYNLKKGDKCLICSTQYKYQLTSQLLSQGVLAEDIYYYDDEWVRQIGGSFSASSEGIFFTIPNQIKVLFVDKSQEDIFYEVFYEECYNFCSSEDMVLIDIGLNAGFASLYFALKENIKRVYGFEPDMRLFSQAKNNIQINTHLMEKIMEFPYALSDENKTERYVNIENIAGGIRKLRNTDRIEDSFEMQCVDSLEVITDIVKNNPDKKIILKSDCEGAEYDILGRLEKGNILGNIHIILMEWHMGRRKDLEDLLKRNGYNYVIRNTTETFGLCYAYLNK